MASLRALHLERKWSKRRERRRGETFEKGKLILLWFAGGLKKNKTTWSPFFLLARSISRLDMEIWGKSSCHIGKFNGKGGGNMVKLLEA